MIEKIKKVLHIKPKEVEKTTEEKINEMFNALAQIDILRIEIGSDLVRFNEEICDEIWKVREEYKTTLGYVLPGVRVIDNTDMQENCFQILIREKVVYEDYIVPNKETVLKEMSKSLKQISIDYIDDIFSMEVMEKYLEEVNKNNNWLIWDATRFYSVSGLKLILVSLIKQGQSIADISYVIEKINEYIVENSNYFEEPAKIARGVKKVLG